MDTGAIYYHAGPRSIAASGIVKPAASLNIDRREAYAGRCEYIAEKVYVTTSLRVAVVMATRVAKAQGVVFEVEPIGDIQPDPDYTSKASGPCVAFMCDGARVIRRVKIPGNLIKRARAEFDERMRDRGAENKPSPWEG